MRLCPIVSLFSVESLEMGGGGGARTRNAKPRLILTLTFERNREANQGKGGRKGPFVDRAFLVRARSNAKRTFGERSRYCWNAVTPCLIKMARNEREKGTIKGEGEWNQRDIRG